MGRVLVLFALWIAVVGVGPPAELLAGAVVAVGAAALAQRVSGIAGPGLRRQWLAHLPGVAFQTLRDCGTLALVVTRRLRGQRVAGRFVEVPFELGDSDVDAARRAFVTLTTSLMPNSYVVGFDARRGTAVVHELVASNSSPIAEELTRA